MAFQSREFQWAWNGGGTKEALAVTSDGHCQQPGNCGGVGIAWQALAVTSDSHSTAK